MLDAERGAAAVRVALPSFNGARNRDSGPIRAVEGFVADFAGAASIGSRFRLPFCGPSSTRSV
jgi:hypothetical protein